MSESFAPAPTPTKKPENQIAGQNTDTNESLAKSTDLAKVQEKVNYEENASAAGAQTSMDFETNVNAQSTPSVESNQAGKQIEMDFETNVNAKNSTNENVSQAREAVGNDPNAQNEQAPAVESLTSKGQERWNGFKNGCKSLASGAVEGLGKAANKVKGWGETAAVAVLSTPELAASVNDKINKGVESVGRYVGRKGAEAAANISNRYKQGKSYLENLITSGKNYANETLDSAKSSIKSGVEQVGNFVRSSSEWAVTKGRAATNSFWDKLCTSRVSKLEQTVGKHGEDIENLKALVGGLQNKLGVETSLQKKAVVEDSTSSARETVDDDPIAKVETVKAETVAEQVAVESKVKTPTNVSSNEDLATNNKPANVEVVSEEKDTSDLNMWKEEDLYAFRDGAQEAGLTQNQIDKLNEEIKAREDHQKAWAGYDEEGERAKYEAWQKKDSLERSQTVMDFETDINAKPEARVEDNSDLSSWNSEDLDEAVGSAKESFTPAEQEKIQAEIQRRKGQRAPTDSEPTGQANGQQVNKPIGQRAPNA